MYSNSYKGRYGFNYGYRYRYRRGGRTLSGISRSQIPTKITRQEIAKIAKKTIKRDDEMKMFDNSYNSALTQGAWYVQNLFGGWTQNVSSEGHIGRKIQLQGIKLRVRVAANTATSAGAGVVWRFMVFKTSQQLTASVSAAVPQGNIFRTNPSLFDATIFPDTDAISVIMDRTGVINPNTTSTTANDVSFFEANIPFKCVLNTLGETSSYFKEDNYYVYFAAASDNGSIATAGYTQFSWQMMYTDA